MEVIFKMKFIRDQITKIIIGELLPLHQMEAMETLVFMDRRQTEEE